jgi:hypothetical protein
MTAHRDVGSLMREKIAEVESAPQGTRNATLSRAAYCLNFYVRDGALSGDTVDYALTAAARKAGLGEREIQATLASARKGADRDWTPDIESRGWTNDFLQNMRHRKAAQRDSAGAAETNHYEVDLLAGMRNGAWLDAQQFPELKWTVPGVISRDSAYW